MIIRFALLLIFAAIANFVLAFVFGQLTMAGFSVQVSNLGSIVLLCGFSLLLLTGLWAISRLILTSLYGYFTTGRRMERRLLFYISQRNRLNRLFRLKRVRLLYINQQQRKSLLKKHDKKSVSL